MASPRITITGKSFEAARGALLLDAALSNGIDLPYDCRSGHCGTCCVRLLSGSLHGGEGSEPGTFHACQCRVSSDAVIETIQPSGVRCVDGVLTALQPLSKDVMEVGITTERALPYLPGQFAQLKFAGFPSRPYSITHPLRGDPESASVWFHIRRMDGGRVTASLGKRIKPGHRVTLSGPYGSAFFRANQNSRLICVATNTGFAPVWSIAAAALRENPLRRIMIIAGGRSTGSLYMGPALLQLTSFPNVRIAAVCSTPQTISDAILPGRPTDYIPQLLPSDVIYACGAPEMVASVKLIAAQHGVVCYADPFLPASSDATEQGALARALDWFTAPPKRRKRKPAQRPASVQRDQPIVRAPQSA